MPAASNAVAIRLLNTASALLSMAPAASAPLMSAAHAYEALTFALTFSQLQSRQAGWRLRNASTGFRFRGNNGTIGMTDAAGYTYGAHGDGREIHQGITLSGFSTARHQADVCILGHGEVWRTSRTDPEWHDVSFVAECKHYNSGPVGHGEGREFVGMISDLGGGGFPYRHALHGVLVSHGPLHLEAELMARTHGLGARGFVRNVITMPAIPLR